MSDTHGLSLVEARAHAVSGALSAERLTRDSLDRIEQHDKTLRAFALVDAEFALQQARARDQARDDGRRLGPLHGVPIAVKDLIDLAGLPTASGTTVMADRIATSTATVVRNLLDAGAVIIGKTQLTEGAYGRHHPAIDAPINPWHADYWTGVSSSGSGVATSAGLAFASLGSDTGGSIRFPSAACGLVGIKPTYGRVSRQGVFPLAQSLDHIGPMARSVADAARLLGAMAGHDPLDASSLNDPDFSLPAEVPERLDSVRIGVDRSFVEVGVHAEVVAALDEALGTLTDLGVTVVDVVVPEAARLLADSWWLSCGVECAEAHRDFYPRRRAEYGPALAQLIDQGLEASAQDYALLQSVRDRFRDEFEALFGSVDLIAAPTMIAPTQTVVAMEDLAPDPALTNGLLFTAPFDYSGHPTLTLPLSPDERGLPRSFQLIGPLGGEAALVEVGLACERRAGSIGIAPDWV